jgi:hypothetical protein
MMRAGELIRSAEGKGGYIFVPEQVVPKEQRLTEWDTLLRILRGGRSNPTSSVEQDACDLPRFAGELVDLIWEATARLLDSSAIGNTKASAFYETAKLPTHDLR